MKLYANTEELIDFLSGQRKTFKASYDRITVKQTAIDVDEGKCKIEEDAFENLDVTPTAISVVTMMDK